MIPAPETADRNKLAELIALAHEPSSDKRRELLREVTDLFFAGPPEGHSAGEMHLFDGVLGALADEMEQEVRAELAGRMADASVAPRNLIRTLAAEDLGVSAPILSRSKALGEEDLVALAKHRGQAHLRVISSRDDLTTAVSDVIVERGDDTTLGALLGNKTAPLSRQASETVVDRATENPALHEAVIDRQDLPVDLLNEMYFVVEQRLRQRITERNASLDPAALDAALETGRKRLAARDGALPSDYDQAEAQIRALRARGAISPTVLAGFLRHNERTKFLIALCELSEIDFHTARRIVEKRELDALAIICRASDFDRALFLTFAVLILEPGQAMAKAQEYGKLYNDLPKDTALRTMRFWRMRRTTGDVAAA
jgi:uncharacterized protein (DUF2336 family)